MIFITDSPPVIMPRNQKTAVSTAQPLSFTVSIYKILLLLFLVAALSALVGSLAAYKIFKDQKPAKPTQNDLIREFYEVENAVHVSPHTVRKNMDKGDKSFILVDLRSPQEYEHEHIVGAVNIAAYRDPNTSAYGDVDRIVSSFQKLIKDNPQKDIVVYCYSTPCMTGRKIGLMLTGHGIYVKHLGIGWNEWRYFWTLWNHDQETPSAVEDYIVSGKDPGTPKVKKGDLTPCTQGQFGC